MIKIRQDVHVYYLLSCGCIVKNVLSRIQNTGLCPRCMGQRVFIITTSYVKPNGDD